MGRVPRWVLHGVVGALMAGIALIDPVVLVLVAFTGGMLYVVDRLLFPR